MSDTRCPTEPDSGGTGISPVLSPTKDAYLPKQSFVNKNLDDGDEYTYMRRNRSRSVGDTEDFVVFKAFSKWRSSTTCCITT
jgi:hypothetical protein